MGCVGAAFDITENRETAERLAWSERRLREAQGVAHVGSFEWDIRTQYPHLVRRAPANLWLRTRAVRRHLRSLHGSGACRRGRGGEGRSSSTPMPGSARSCTTTGSSGWTEPFVCCIRAATSSRTSAGQADPDGRDVLGRDGAEGAHPEARARRLSLGSDGQRDLRGNPRRGLGRRGRLGQPAIPDLVAGPPLHAAEGLHHVRLLPPRSISWMTRRRSSVVSEDVYAHSQDLESFDVFRFRDGRTFELYSRPPAYRRRHRRPCVELPRHHRSGLLLRRALFLADATRLLASLDVEQALERVAHLAVPYLGDGCAIDLFGNGGPARLSRSSRDPRRPISPRGPPDGPGGHAIVYRGRRRALPGRAACSCKGTLVGAITRCRLRRRSTPRPTWSSPRSWLAAPPWRSITRACIGARRRRSTRATSSSRSPPTRSAGRSPRSTWPSSRSSEARSRRAAAPRVLELVEREDRRLSRFVDELLDLGRIRAAGCNSSSRR